MESSGASPLHDFLAFPIAPAVLVLQFVALRASDRRIRVGVGVAVLALLVVMLGYVLTLDVDGSEGASIGGGILFLAVLASLALLPFSGIQDVVNDVRRRGSR